MRSLKSGRAQLGLRCQVSASTASVVIQDQRFDVRVTERVSESLAHGLAETATLDELLVAQCFGLASATRPTQSPSC